MRSYLHCGVILILLATVPTVFQACRLLPSCFSICTAHLVHQMVLSSTSVMSSSEWHVVISKSLFSYFSLSPIIKVLNHSFFQFLFIVLNVSM